MGYTIEQYRYYNFEGTSLSSNLNLLNLVNQGITPGENNEVFEQIGIQTIPGIEFYFNGDINGSIMIGPSGIYELRVPYADITNIKISENSKNFLENSNGGYLIIDVIINNKSSNQEGEGV